MVVKTILRLDIQRSSSPANHSNVCYAMNLRTSSAAKSLIMAFAIIFSLAAPARAQTSAKEKSAVNTMLNALHDSASKGDWDVYFDLYTDSSIFLGTDATERWTKSDFKGYAAGSNGWTYEMTERHIFVSDDLQTAWFDELLENDNLGLTRGTGVLVKKEGEWKFSQYNLTIPVPNSLARSLVAEIRSLDDME